MMKANSRSRATKPCASPPLSETEWDFEPVPKDEMDACFFYEYSREYFKRCPTLQKLREQWEACEVWWQAHMGAKPRPTIPKKHKTGFMAFHLAANVLKSKVGFRVPVDFRTFPNVCWRQLRERPRNEAWPVRAGIADAKQRDRSWKSKSNRFHIETLAQLEPADIRSLPGWIHYHEFFHREQDLSNTQYGFFAINLNYPGSEILRAFCEWLEERESERKGSLKIVAKSRGEFRDK